MDVLLIDLQPVALKRDGAVATVIVQQNALSDRMACFISAVYIQESGAHTVDAAHSVAPFLLPAQIKLLSEPLARSPRCSMSYRSFVTIPTA